MKINNNTVTSLRRILKENKITLSESVYYESPILDYPISAVGEWGIKSEKTFKNSYLKIIRFQKMMAEKKNETEYKKILEQISELPNDEKILKSKLRAKKKRIENRFRKQSELACFGVNLYPDTPVSISYKSGASAIDISEFPEFSQIIAEHSEIALRPWFTGDPEKLRLLLSSERPVGMEGGACLIGNNELCFSLTLKNGENHIFDFNSMRRIKNGCSVLSSAVSSELYEFVKIHKNSIEAAETICIKKALSIDEYEEIQFLFALAKVCNAKLVITVPDMSYEKTFLKIFEELPKNIFEPFYKLFMKEVYRICDISLIWIEKFKKNYGMNDAVILHKRNTDAVSCFEESKKLYINDYIKRHLTKKTEMEPALLDYICMPAAPFYLWGIKDIIEINRLEEYPSIEKCLNIHRGKISLNYMLYPQRLSKNGKTSCFYAEENFKEYIY